MADRPEMFGPGLLGGFRGWLIQWHHAKCCGADPCCHGKEIWARRGDPVAYRLVLILSMLIVNLSARQRHLPSRTHILFSRLQLYNSQAWYSMIVHCLVYFITMSIVLLDISTINDCVLCILRQQIIPTLYSIFYVFCCDSDYAFNKQTSCVKSCSNGLSA